MLKIKRLYTFIIQSFLPMFAMTFVICLFILLMQFLWRFVEDLVGKGLDNSVLAELFIYAALQLIPMALPLSLLLASLMTFGNLGERLELLAIKASGISLLKTMRPLMIFVALIAIGAFFFQNEAMPRIQVKLRSLIISIKQKSPELEIPEGAFYSITPDYNIYVKNKNKETGMLKDVMIYDSSEGFNQMSVFVCDSALMKMAESKDYLLLTLYQGQRFANAGKQMNTQSSSGNQFIPYTRENFKDKKIIIPFEGGFERMDESALDGTQISKNIVQLSHSIDSLSLKLDTINRKDRTSIGKYTYLTYRNTDSYKKDKEIKDSLNIKTTPIVLNYDSLLNTFTDDEMQRFLSTATSTAENSRLNVIEMTSKTILQRNVRLHKVEWHQKFVLSFACLIFFFIGAPLGAIIRKGGLGMPVVVSVLFFIFYYIINNIGLKMARDGVWESWQGMWLSSAVLFPLGAFLTYKAMNDSALFNVEAYNRFFRKILYIKTPPKISEEERQTIINNIPDISELSNLRIDSETMENLSIMDDDKLKDIYKNYYKYGYGYDMKLASIILLKDKGTDISDLIDNESYKMASSDYELFCESSILTSIGFILAIIALIFKIPVLTPFICVGYILLFIRSLLYYSMFYTIINIKSKIYHIFISIFAFVAYPLAYWYIKKDMEKNLNEIKKSTVI